MHNPFSENKHELYKGIATLACVTVLCTVSPCEFNSYPQIRHMIMISDNIYEFKLKIHYIFWFD